MLNYKSCYDVDVLYGIVLSWLHKGLWLLLSGVDVCGTLCVDTSTWFPSVWPLLLCVCISPWKLIVVFNIEAFLCSTCHNAYNLLYFTSPLFSGNCAVVASLTEASLGSLTALQTLNARAVALEGVVATLLSAHQHQQSDIDIMQVLLLTLILVCRCLSFLTLFTVMHGFSVTISWCLLLSIHSLLLWLI